MGELIEPVDRGMADGGFAGIEIGSLALK